MQFPFSFSYWHNDSAPEARQSGKRMASQYILPQATITQPIASTHSNNNSPFIRTVQQQSSPFQTTNEFSSTVVIRRTKPGGDNVRRTAEANDRRFHQMEVNRESQQTQLLASWHSLHEKQNKQGERRRNEKQLVWERER